MYYPPGVFEHDIRERPTRAPPPITLSEEAFMAHEIDLSTGKPAIAYVEETPWHGLGERLPQNEPIEVWIKAAGLNWELKRLPVQYLFDAKLRVMDGRFILARSDNGAALSVVSSDYHVVQPKEVLEFYRDLVGSFQYTLETAGALNGGRKVWALAKTGKTTLLHSEKGSGTSDEVCAYVLLATSCDKSLATTIAFTSIRVVCQNTLFFAKDDVAKNKRPHLKVPHSVRFDSHEIKKELGLIDRAWGALSAKIQKLTEHHIEEKMALSFFENLLLRKDEKALSSKAQRDLSSIMSHYESAPGQNLTTAKGTLWGAVNAVTYYVDHVRSGGAGERLDSAWFGAGSVLKDRAWAAACDLVDQPAGTSL
jgi:phage/plasmid-like protein (TIGR03299 family)